MGSKLLQKMASHLLKMQSNLINTDKRSQSVSSKYGITIELTIMVEIKRSHDFNHSTWIIVEEARNNIVSICELVAGNEIHHPRGLIGDRITGKLKVGSYLTDDEIKSLNEDIKNPNRFRIEIKRVKAYSSCKKEGMQRGNIIEFSGNC
jgi:hypothetical protein